MGEIYLDLLGAGDAGLAHAPGHHGGVGCPATPGGEHTLGRDHAVDVVRVGLDPDQDHFLAPLGGGLGSVGEKAATAISDFVVVDMFANYCTGREDVKGSIAIAERQLKRIYR